MDVCHLRDTGTIEQHAQALVGLLESCLNYDLRPSSRDEDPPHAKIASDIVSCIFLVRGITSFISFSFMFFCILPKWLRSIWIWARPLNITVMDVPPLLSECVPIDEVAITMRNIFVLFSE